MGIISLFGILLVLSVFMKGIGNTSIEQVGLILSNKQNQSSPSFLALQINRQLACQYD